MNINLNKKDEPKQKDFLKSIDQDFNDLHALQQDNLKSNEDHINLASVDWTDGRKVLAENINENNTSESIEVQADLKIKKQNDFLNDLDCNFDTGSNNNNTNNINIINKDIKPIKNDENKNQAKKEE